MWATTLQNHPWPLLQWGVVVGASLAAAVTDAKARRIPNWLTGPLFIGGLVQATLVGGGAGVLDSAVATIVLAMPYIVLFLFAGGGAGDAKLMGALGSWLGVVQGALVLAAVAVAGVLLALVYARSKRRLGEVRSTLAASAKGLVAPILGAGSIRDIPGHLPDPNKGLKMPYGIAICAGVLAAAGGRLLWQLR